MEANKLRIGNYINILCGNGIDGREYKTYQLTSFDIYKADESECFDIRPIPLTEEWLFKFSFEKCSCAGYKLSGKVNFHIEKDFTYKGSSIKEMKVHELQNLYFALTKQELIISN